MSTLSRAELEAMDRDELVETVQDLSQTVENLELSVDVLDRLVHEQADEIDSLEADLADAEQRLHKERSKLMRRVSAIEDELGIESSQAVAIAEAGSDDADMSKLARMMRYGPDAVIPDPSARHHRAKTLLDNWDRWGETRSREKDSLTGEWSNTKTWVLKSREHDIRTRLEDARNESLQWTQVYRAMELIADWGDDAVRLKDDSGTGKTLTLRVEVDE